MILERRVRKWRVRRWGLGNRRRISGERMVVKSLDANLVGSLTNFVELN